MYRLLVLTFCLAATPALHAQNREEKVRADRAKVEADGYWIYNDLARGFALAKEAGKPMLVVLRCIPCEECVKLDDDLVNQDPRVRPLLDQFIRVRVIMTNGLDLSLFQFDYDQSFAGFFLNGDGAIYGRFGTRSHRTHWSGDVSIEGLAKALQAVLRLHEQYPKNRDLLARKKGPTAAVSSPEQYGPLRKYKPTLDYEGKVVPSCIHCHQIGDAQRQAFRDRKEPIPEELLFSYPHPKALGLILDPKECATVERVEPDSPAEEAGFRKGDEIGRLAGQPLVSIADVQWVLHRTPAEGASVKAEVNRDGKPVELTLKLPDGWRRRDDLSWRVSSWGLRRMVLGGLVLEELPADGRKKAGLAEKGMALRVKHVGQYGPHAAAQKAGFRQGDVIVAFGERSDWMRETDLLAHAVRTSKPGERVAVAVVRDGKRLELTLPMQE